MSNKKEKPLIHFWVPYPVGIAPSQRFRVELFLPKLKEAGYSFKLLTFLDQNAWDVLYKPGNRLLKAWGTVKGYFRRVGHLFQSLKADYVFIHREATADRVNIGVMTFLSLATLSFDIRNYTAPVSYLTALDWFVIMAYAFLLASLLQFAFVHYFTKVK